MSTRAYQRVRKDSGTGVKNVQRIRRRQATFFRVKLTVRGNRNFHVGYRPTLELAARMARAARRVFRAAAIALVLALAWSAPVAGQSLTLPTVIYLGGSALDAGTTLSGITSGRCVETTNGMRWGSDHPEAFAVFSVGVAVGEVYLWRWIGRRYAKVAWVALVARGVARGAVGVTNCR